jgi:hypothetical protein
MTPRCFNNIILVDELYAAVLSWSGEAIPTSMPLTYVSPHALRLLSLFPTYSFHKHPSSVTNFIPITPVNFSHNIVENKLLHQSVYKFLHVDTCNRSKEKKK